MSLQYKRVVLAVQTFLLLHPQSFIFSCATFSKTVGATFWRSSLWQDRKTCNDKNSCQKTNLQFLSFPTASGALSTDLVIFSTTDKKASTERWFVYLNGQYINDLLVALKINTLFSSNINLGEKDFIFIFRNLLSCSSSTRNLYNVWELFYWKLKIGQVLHYI